MQEKKDFYSTVELICAKDSRYKPDAYEFVIQALHFTQKKLKKQTHITGKELSEGLRDFAISQFGPMTKTVFTHWGITRTHDFGNIVFSMIDKKLLSKTEEDSINDFSDVYDFEVVFANVLRDSVIKDIGKG
ncbi:MAG: Minf_1886 family protein [Candidatus Omnitrophota bacterium]